MKNAMRGSLGVLFAIGFFSVAAFAQSCGTPACAPASPCGQPSCRPVHRPKTCYSPQTCSTCRGQDLGVACNRGNFCGANTCKSDCGVRIPKCLDLGGPNVKVKNGKVYAWQGFPSACATPGQAVAVIEKLAPATVCVEDEICYEIQVTNRGKGGLTNVVITDVLPAGFTLTKVEPEVPVADGKLVFNIGDLEGNSAKQYRIFGRAASTGCLVFEGQAQATFSFPIALPVTVIQCALDVAVTAPDCVDLCDCFNVTICVKNPGSAPSTDNCVTVQLPEGLTDTRGESTFTFAVPTLRPGEAKTFTLRNLKAARTGSYTVTAIATNARGITSASSASVKIRQPELVVTKRATGKVYLDKKVAYEITVTNAGDCPAKDVVLTDVFAADSAAVVIGTANPRPSAGSRGAKNLSWNLGTLQPGETRTICYDITACEAGTIKNTATATAYCAEPRCAEAITQVEGVPGIVSCVTDDVDPAELGELVTYTIETKNQGRVANTNLRYVVTLDEGMEFVSAAAPKGLGFKQDGNTITFEALPSLANRQTARWTVTVKAMSVGDKRLVTRLMTDQFQKDRPVIVEAPTTFYQSEMVTSSSAVAVVAAK